MKITASEISKRWNIDKSKVSRALAKGELSGEKPTRKGGSWSIEVAEAERWANSLNEKPVRSKMRESATPSATPDESLIELIELRAEVKALRQMNETLQADKDDWKKQAQNAQQLLLTDGRPKKAGIISRLFGSSES